MSALTLPRLSGVPTQYLVAGASDWTRKLLLELQEDGAILPEDFAGRPVSMAQLLKNVLRRHWLEITRGARAFRWDLIASHWNSSWQAADNPSPWLLICASARENDPWPCPTFYIGEALLRLEDIAAGLGETVLAALYDALKLLPNTLTPRRSLWQAEFVYWHGEQSESAAADAWGESLGEDVFRRDQFFEHMPEWAAHPKRRLTTKQIRAAAERDEFAAAVVAALDSAVLTAGNGSDLADCSFDDAEPDSTCWTAWLRWSPADAAERIADDWCNYVTQGEYIDAATAYRCSGDGRRAAAWLRKMRRTAQVAREIEQLLLLIATPANDETMALCEVRV